jgi:hypothetical protein
MEEQCQRNLRYLKLDSEELYEEFTGHKLNEIVETEHLVKGSYTEEVARATQHVVCEDSPRIPLHVIGTGFTLYPPQAGLIAMMLLIEGKHSWIDTTDLRQRLANYYGAYQSNVGFVTERLSFGKSTLIPAMIRHQPVSQWTKCELDNLCAHGPRLVVGPCTQTVNVIVASRITVDDWDKRLKRTDIPYVLVKSEKGINDALKLVEQSPAVAIIVIRHGTMMMNGSKERTLTHFARAFGSYEFSRVFYDDYDMLDLYKIPKRYAEIMDDGAELPIARFHWLLSATANAIEYFPYEHRSGGPVDGRYTPAVERFGSKRADISYSENTFRSMGNCHGAYRLAFFSTRCNTSFAQVEFQVPPMRWYTAPDLRSIILAIAKDTDLAPLSITEFKRSTRTFVSGVASTPYVRLEHGFRMLVSVENKDEQRALVDELVAAGVNAVLLDKRNIRFFGLTECKDGVVHPAMLASVGVSRLIHGVSMGFLTHVVVLERNYTPEQIDQVVGRAQRLDRKHDLQVYMVPAGTDAGYAAGNVADLTTAAHGAEWDADYAKGFAEAMFDRGIEAGNEAEEPLTNFEGLNVDYVAAYREGVANARGYADGLNGRPQDPDPSWDDVCRDAYLAAYEDGKLMN